MGAASEARVAMETPRRYMSQLCKHFEHKLPVTLDETSGTIAFPMGVCRLTAADDHLIMRVEAAEADLAKLKEVVERHLTRFAFRAPPTIVWQKEGLLF